MSALRNIFEREATKSSPAITPRPPEVRIAGMADEEAIFGLWMLLHAENALAPVNEGKVRAILRRALRRDNAVIGVIEVSNVIVACVCLVMSQPWYSEGWYLEELENFVHPDHRKGAANHGQKLIQFSKWWSEQVGMPLVMSILSSKRTLGKIRLYMRSMHLSGAVFMWGARLGDG